MTGTRARPGFTLLEVAVVLAITVIGGLLVLPRWNRPLATDAAGADALFDGDAPGTLLARTLLLARGHAIATRQVVTVRFDVANRTMRAEVLAATGAGLRTATRARHVVEAEALALEVYARLALASDAALRALPDSLAGGQFPEPFAEYDWRATVRPHAEWAGLVTVEIAVTWPEGAHRLASALYRRAPAAALEEGL